MAPYRMLSDPMRSDPVNHPKQPFTLASCPQAAKIQESCQSPGEEAGPSLPPSLPPLLGFLQRSKGNGIPSNQNDKCLLAGMQGAAGGSLGSRSASAPVSQRFREGASSPPEPRASAWLPRSRAPSCTTSGETGFSSSAAEALGWGAQEPPL